MCHTDTHDTNLHGAVDLLLARNPAEDGSLATEELWVIDYKTGAKKSLASSTDDVEKRRAALRKRLLDGTALQLGLYALAAIVPAWEELVVHALRNGLASIT